MRVTIDRIGSKTTVGESLIQSRAFIIHGRMNSRERLEIDCCRFGKILTCGEIMILCKQKSAYAFTSSNTITGQTQSKYLGSDL